jgi:hypothetical protein
VLHLELELKQYKLEVEFHSGKKMEKAAYDKLYRERTAERRKANRDHRNRLKKLWREKNKDKTKAEYRRYYVKNAELLKARTRTYQREHREQKRQYDREWARKNHDRHIANKREWAEKNREKIRVQKNEARARNPEKYRATAKKWRDACSPESRETARRGKRNFMSRRLSTDPVFNTFQRIRRRLLSALHGLDKSKCTAELLGCSKDELRAHIESLFLPGMSWEGVGRHGIHIDHIVPCSWFDLSDPVEQKQCFHYTNLRPLWAWDNRSKSDKVIPELHGPNIPTIKQLTSTTDSGRVPITQTKEGDTRVS